MNSKVDVVIGYFVQEEGEPPRALEAIFSDIRYLLNIQSFKPTVVADDLTNTQVMKLPVEGQQLDVATVEAILSAHNIDSREVNVNRLNDQWVEVSILV
jgi:hypothetical protein